MPSVPVIFDRASADKIAIATRAVLNDAEAGPFGHKRPSYLTRPLSFWATATSDGTKATCTGGNVVLPQTAATYYPCTTLAEYSLTDDSDNWIWVERVDDEDWQINKGTSLPSDKFYVLIADIVLASGEITNFVRYWRGGEIVIPTVFPVRVKKTGGSSGDSSSTCSYTYEVRAAYIAGDVLLLTAASPTRGRISNVAYSTNASFHYGIAYFDGSGAIQLYESSAEVPNPDTVTVVTSVDFGASSVTTKDLRVLDSA